MYRNTNFQTHYQFPLLSPKSYANLNPQTLSYTAGQSNQNLNQNIAKLIRENQILSENLQIERERNFNLLEVKRKMQDDIQRLQFELERIANYEDLGKKQIQIKKYQLAQGNTKLQAQLDQYFEENKRIRAELRKCMSECETLARQKQDLVNQNVSLLGQVAGLKQKMSQYQHYQQQSCQPQQKLIKHQTSQKQVSQNLHSITTIRSIHQPNNPPSSYYINQDIYQSPKSHSQVPNLSEFHKRFENSTNPSDKKLLIHSPIAISDHPQKIQEDFYGDFDPSPRSFNNKKIHEKLQLISSKEMQPLKIGSKTGNWDGYQQKTLIQPLKLNTTYENEGKLEVEQKKELKDEVAKIRNQIVDELIGKYFNSSLERAEKEKTNSLKLFIASLQPNLATLDHMVINYLEARQMLMQSCPTLRSKWEPFHYSNPTRLNEVGTRSEIVEKNSISISQMYERIKEGRVKQKSKAGQYLALFRLLTLVYKLDVEIDPQLSECIKHTALKQVHRIKEWGDNKLAYQE